MGGGVVGSMEKVGGDSVGDAVTGGMEGEVGGDSVLVVVIQIRTSCSGCSSLWVRR